MKERWLSPLLLSLTAGLEGFSSPDPKERFNYAFLFFEDATFFISLASVYPYGNFFGIEPNEFFLKKAEELKKELFSGNVTLSRDLSEDLPELDYIIINQYSLLPEKKKEEIIELLKKKLKENGILCICYDALPGKMSHEAFCKFIQRLFPDSGKDRVKKALNFLRMFVRRGSFYLQSNPEILREIQYFLSKKRSMEELQERLKRSILSPHFRPEFFYEVFEKMKNSGLNYIGSAEAYLNEIELSVPPSQVPTFFEVSKTELSETLKDFIRNTTERADLYTRSERIGLERTIPFWCKRLKIFNIYPLSYISKVVDLPGGAKLPIKDQIFEKIHNRLLEGEPSIELSELLEFSERQIRKGILRLLVNQEFNLTFSDTEIRGPDKKEGNTLSKANRIILNKSIDLFTPFSPISDKSRGVGMTLNPIEALLLNVYLEDKDDLRHRFFEEIKKYRNLSASELENIIRIFQEKTLYGLLKTGII